MKHFKKYWGVYAAIAAFLIIIAINWKQIMASFQGKAGGTGARESISPGRRCGGMICPPGTVCRKSQDGTQYCSAE